MKKILTTILAFLGLLTLGASIGVNAASTTVSMSTFTALEGNIGDDTNVSYTTDKGGGTSAPVINNGVIRLYQNASGGGTITISVATGYNLIGATVGSSMNTSVAYTLNDSTEKSTTKSLAANDKYSVTGITASSITFHCMGSDKSHRLYVNYLEATYENQADDSKPFVTFKTSAEDEGMKININDTGILSSIPSNPLSELQVFTGWKDESAGTVYTVEDLATATFAGNTTVLVAQYRNKTAYTITYFDGDTALVVDDALSKLYEGDEITYRPKKSGYAFEGWYKEKTLDTLADSVLPKAVDENVGLDLYAKWSESPYNVIDTMDEVLDATYALGVTYSNKELFLGEYVKNSTQFNSVDSFSAATQFNVEKVSDGSYTISFMLNDKKNYIGAIDSANISIAETLLDGYYWNIKASSTGFTITNKTYTTRSIAYRSSGVFKAYASNNMTNKDYEFGIQLYQIKGTAKTVVDHFSATNTISSLKVVYDTATLQATNVDLRFGTLLEARAFSSEAKYGVLVTANVEKVFAAGATTFATVDELLAANTDVKKMECTAVADGDGYRFAWVIDDMEDHYKDQLVAVIYMEYQGVLYLGVSVKESVVSKANHYFENSSDYSFTENQLEVLLNLATIE